MSSKFFFIIFLFLSLLEVNAQQNSYKFFQVAQDTLNYSIYFAQEDDHYALKKNQDSTAKVIIIKNLELNIFRNALRIIFTKKELSENALYPVASKLLTQIIQEQTEDEIESRLNQLRDLPKIQIGTLTFKNKDSVWINIAEVSNVRKFLGIDCLKADTILKKNNYRFRVSSIEIAFEDGLMKDISATGELSDNKSKTINVQFKNNSFPPVRKPTQMQRLNYHGINYLEYIEDSVLYKIDFSDLIYFRRKVIMATGNYIPADEVIEINKKTPEAKIYKKEFDDNFDIRLFTDVTGFQEENPNGVVQFEGNLNLIINNDTVYEGLVFLNNIMPYISFPKIENKLTNLPPHIKYNAVNINDSLRVNISENSTTTIDVMKYNNLDIGCGFNVATYFLPAAKIKLNTNAGLIRTTVDSTTINTIKDDNLESKHLNVSDIYLYYISSELLVKWINGEYLSLDVGLGYYWTDLFGKHNNIYVKGSRNTWKALIGINIFTNPKETFKQAVFFRSTLITDSEYRVNNLMLQIGYSTPVTNIF